MTDKRMITMEQFDEAYALDEQRTGLLLSRHHFRNAKAFTVSVATGSYSYSSETTIERDEAPDAFAAVEAFFERRIAELEAEIRAMGVEPSKWTPPAEVDAQ